MTGPSAARPGQGADEERVLRELVAMAPAIDPDAEPPTLESLLAGTEFEDALPPAPVVRPDAVPRDPAEHVDTEDSAP